MLNDNYDNDMTYRYERLKLLKLHEKNIFSHENNSTTQMIPLISVAFDRVYFHRQSVTLITMYRNYVRTFRISLSIRWI